MEAYQQGLERLLGPDRRRTLGAGVIIDASGTALTSAHLVKLAPDLEVLMADGTTPRVTVVGLDLRSDLAVLKLEDGRSSFPAVRLDDSDKVVVGDWVLAIGAPYGLESTVTAGIISATARNVRDDGFDFFQSDAPVNVGNAGGPLIGVRGEVIGIVTAFSTGPGVVFALPSNAARSISGALLDKGRVNRGWLGLWTQEVTPELARAFERPEPGGALVVEVASASPADAAGLRVGDIVLGLETTAVTAPAGLNRALARAAPGSLARLRVWRDRREITLTPRIGEEPDDGDKRAASTRVNAALGIEVRALAPGLPPVVTRVEPDSPAGRNGVRRGDIIREINRQPVRTLADFDALTRDLRRGGELIALLQRGASALYVALSLRADNNHVSR